MTRKYSLDELLGATDVARILGWDIRKVSAYAGTGKAGFPKPVGEIGGRPVWYRGDVEAFKAKIVGVVDEETFAQALGFDDWNELMDASEHVVSEPGDVDWWITRLPDGRWAAWDDAELAVDRVEYFDTREEAIRFHRGGFEAAELPEECWLLD